MAKILVSKSDFDRAFFERCIKALEESAYTEAGLSMEPYLITKEETQQWQDAQLLRAALDQGVLS